MARGRSTREPLADRGNGNGVNLRTRSATGALAEPKPVPKKKPPSNDSWKTRENLFGTKNPKAWNRKQKRALDEAKNQVPGK